jgi:integrase
MDAARAVRLRSIPPEPDSDPEQPFLFPAIGADKSKELWRYRFQQLCEFAGITEIETELGVRRRPHPHMLRDTFAIDAISRGANIRSVSRMMGHANSLITERVYLMWVEKVDRHCIEDQRAALARVQAPDDLVEVSEDVGVVIQ